MEQHHRRTINNNISNLINSTQHLKSIVNLLCEKNVINEWMKDYILEPVESTGKRRLYEVIQGRGPKAFVNLCKTLNETSNNVAVRILEQNASFQLIESGVNNLWKPNGSNNNLNEGSSVNQDVSYVKIHPERLRMDLLVENFPTGAYPMGSNPKGYTLILNMYKVKDRDDRPGSERDVKSLERLFDGLGYVVQTEVDLNETQFIEVIKAFVDKCHSVKTDSIVVFIMSHGEAGLDSTRSSDIMTADNKSINTDWIIEQFKPLKIPSNIPKLFFFQACRGNNSDHGWRMNNQTNPKLQNDTSDHNNLPGGTITNRRYENVFIAHATVPGYNAKRDTVTGSWFVQNMCAVVAENAWKYDLNDMMKMVDLEIKKLNCDYNGFQTVEWTYRGFNKKFYFNPGLYDDNSDHNH